MEGKKYPIGGYAPGNYCCKCYACNVQFLGDKRAVQCEPCAVAAKKGFDALSPEEQAELLKRNAEAIIEMFTKWNKPGLPPSEPILTDEDVKAWHGMKREESVLSVFVPCLENDPRACGGYTSNCGRSLCYVRESNVPVIEQGAVWVKANERLPDKGGVDNKVLIRGILNEQGYFNHSFVSFGFRNFSPVKQEMYFEYGSRSFLTNDVEWLDESGAAPSGEREVEFAEWILEQEYYGEDGKWWMNAFSEGAKAFTTAQLWEIWQKEKTGSK